MLDSDTKRRIDSCRDILVGRVPDPKSQVEQITIALIYKFMDDMDAQSEELGGKRAFFAGDFAQYGWAKLLSPAVGGFDMVSLYSEAIARMGENPGIPTLFRDIFKRAYLPYRDPETLRAFLKEINVFTYEHSEKLGDAFEYLLSVLGSQGDAGQFRTPRHIIDFIVAVVNPQKNETILDPACGTAGFLISSYKHILAANMKDRPGDLLTADERTRLAANLVGYDISPDMVRLSLANLYLHGFPEPQVEEYDTLTSDDKWNQYADVILANPPFMSPKGGIKPHKRFSVPSNRSEVLFVDYIAEHLTPTGRAGIIVPEGIIFQSGTSYKTLRKMLVESYLVSVVSLPAGVFQPYSGVKTSVLILDKRLAKGADSVLFVKIASDGFGLGAQRRAVALNDLPEAARLLTAWTESLRDGNEFDLADAANVQVVPKSKIAATVDYNLSADRYLKSLLLSSVYPKAMLGEVCDIFNGSTPSRENKAYWNNGDVPWFTVEDIRSNGRIVRSTSKKITRKALDETSVKLLPKHTILLSCTASVGEYAYTEIEATTNQQFNGLVVKKEFNCKLDAKFLFCIASAFKHELIRLSGQTSFNFVSVKTLKTIEIPLPPLAVQHEIVAEIEAYQKVIDGARQVVENYKPRIDVRPEWPMVELDKLCELVRGSSPRPQGDSRYFGGPVPRLMIADITRDGMKVTPSIDSLTEEGATKSRPMKAGDVVMAASGNPGLPGILCVDACIHDGFVGFRNLDGLLILPEYFYYVLLSKKQVHNTQSVGAVFLNLNTDQIRTFLIPLPDLETQRAIVAEIEAEQRLVDGAKALISRFEAKVKAAIGRVWGEGD